MLPNGKPGDKENIPLSQKRLLAGIGAADVIDLCGPDGANSSRSVSVHQQRASSSSVVTDVIDLCADSPIKRSVPSIAATLTSKKRKLDILREGGLEVTPISSSFGGAAEPDVVTITKTISIDTDRGSRNSSYESTSIEILDPKKYTLSNEGGRNHNRSRSSSQILDLSTIRNNGMTEDNLIKKISPNLGPNIEISIVPTDESQRDLKKRKALQLPIPALRKISTGELSVKNLSMKVNEMNRKKVMVAAAPSRKAESNLAKDLKPSVSITAADKFSTATNLGLSSNMNESLYVAALYNTVLPSATSNDCVNEDLMTASTYQHPLSFLAGSFLQQQQQQQFHQLQQNLNNGSSKLSKKNGVSNE